MEVELPSDMLAPGRAVFSELLALNKREVDAFNGVVSDYLVGMQMIRELQVTPQSLPASGLRTSKLFPCQMRSVTVMGRLLQGDARRESLPACFWSIAAASDSGC